MNKQLLNRRQFSARCAAFGLSFPALGTTLAARAAGQVLGTDAASKPAGRTVKLPDGTRFRRSVKAAGTSVREGIRPLSRKRRCAQAFRSA